MWQRNYIMKKNWFGLPWYHDKLDFCYEHIQSFREVESQFEESFSNWSFSAEPQIILPAKKKIYMVKILDFFHDTFASV
jgi:hypothetical protein